MKEYNVEIHAQSAVEGIIQLCKKYNVKAEDIAKVKPLVFNKAFKIIGGGKAGNRHNVTTKEQANHGLPYAVAAAILDDAQTVLSG